MTPLHADRDVPGTLSLRFRCKMVVRELRLFLRLYPSVFRTTRTSRSETETPVVAVTVAFAFHYVINGSFSIIGRKQSFTVPVSGA
jgi:hypothetical protein